MTEKSAIESQVEAFIARKTAEAVFVDVGHDNTICIKHRSIHGSISLAVFWINVLQHPNNYPPKHFPYKKHYDSHGPYKIVLRTDDVTISVCMKTGALTIRGMFVIEWFLDKIPGILSGFESPPGPPRPAKGTFKEIEEDYRRELLTQKRRRADEIHQMRRKLADRIVAESLEMPLGIVTIDTREEKVSDEVIQEEEKVAEFQNTEEENVQTEKDLVIDEQTAEIEEGQTVEGEDEQKVDVEQEPQEENEPTDEQEPQVEETTEAIPEGEDPEVEKIQQDVSETETAVIELCNEVVVSEEEEREWQEKLSSMDMWPEEILQKELEKIRYPCIKDGPSYIYTVWKSLLNLWFSDQDRKVYIAAPVLDVERLQDICDIFLQQRLTASIDVMYVPQDLKHIANLRRKTLDSYCVNDQIFIEYKVLNSMVFPPKNFQARFIAAAKDGKVDILVTSAGFHRDHFINSSEDTLIFQTLDESTFTKKFMKQLHSK